MVVERTLSNIVILRNGFSPSEDDERFPPDEYDRVTVRELKDRLRESPLSELFRYEKASMRIDDYDRLTHPLKSALVLRGLGRKGYFVDADGDRTSVTLGRIAKFAGRFAVDLARRPLVHRRHRRRVKELEERSDALPTLNASKSPLYVRADLWPDAVAGGSVAHTAGVVNNMDAFGGDPYYFSSVEVPTVDAEIARHIVAPPDRLRDFPETREIAFNDTFLDRGRDSFDAEDLSFVYQRYARYNYSGVALAEAFDIPFVLEYNGSEVWISENWGRGIEYPEFAERVEQVNLEAADLIVAVSDTIRETLAERGIDLEKVLVNPNGVDPEAYSPAIDGNPVRREYSMGDETVIGFIGTFGPWHGAEVLAEAFGELLQDRPDEREDIRLLLIGDGPRMPDVREILAEYDATDRTVTTGLVPQEEGPKYLAATDLLISPHVPNPDDSDFFGSPTKLFEYMAMGKAVVASDLDQIGEVIDHEETGLLVSPADVDALVDGIERLLDDPELPERLGKAARAEIETTYTWRAHTRRIFEALEERCSVE